MPLQIQLRRGTSAQWNSVNPILAQAEVAIETDTNKFKIGNGTTNWINLPYGGLQGTQGIQGITGSGIQGIQGTIGASIQGTQGTTGSGTQGIQGIQGINAGQLLQNSQSASYTVELADAGKHIFHPGTDTTARTWIIPQTGTGVGQVNWPLGTILTFVNQHGAGAISIQITNDTMRLAVTGETGTRTLAANGIASCIKITSTEWLISGVGIS